MKRTLALITYLYFSPHLSRTFPQVHPCVRRGCSGQTALCWCTASATGSVSTWWPGSSKPSSPPKTTWGWRRCPLPSWATNGTSTTDVQSSAKKGDCWPWPRTVSFTRCQLPRTTTACWWCSMGWWNASGSHALPSRRRLGSRALWRACQLCLPGNALTPSEKSPGRVVRRSLDRLGGGCFTLPPVLEALGCCVQCSKTWVKLKLLTGGGKL